MHMYNVTQGTKSISRQKYYSPTEMERSVLPLHDSRAIYKLILIACVFWDQPHLNARADFLDGTIIRFVIIVPEVMLRRHIASFHGG